LKKIRKTLTKCAVVMLNNYQIVSVWTCKMKQICEKFELTTEKLMNWVSS
jgi:hypothetical protein